MSAYTEQLADLIKQDIDHLNANKKPSDFKGSDWWQFSESELDVFRIKLKRIPHVLALHVAYEDILGICHAFNGMTDELREGFLRDHDWLKQSGELPKVSLSDFQKFGKLFGYSYRETHAWYAKFDAWNIRAGVTRFGDEKAREDGEIPF